MKGAAVWAKEAERREETPADGEQRTHTDQEEREEERRRSQAEGAESGTEVCSERMKAGRQGEPREGRNLCGREEGTAKGTRPAAGRRWARQGAHRSTGAALAPAAHTA